MEESMQNAYTDWYVENNTNNTCLSTIIKEKITL